MRVFTPDTTILDQDTTFFSAWGSDTSWMVDFSQADYGSTLYQQIIVGIAEEGLASLTFVIVEGQNDVPTISYASTETDDWLQPDIATFRIVIDETGTGSFYLDGVLQYEIPDVIGDVSVSAFVFAESDDTTSTWTVGVPGTAEASTVSAEVVDDDLIASAEDSDLDITLLAVPKSDGDTITSVEAGTLTVTLTGSDSAAGVDAQALVVSLAATDTGVGVDAATPAATLTGADTVTSIEAGTLAVPVSSADTGTSTEGQTVTAGDASADSVLSGEASTVTASLVGIDLGSAVDTQTLTVQVSGADMGSFVESAQAVKELFDGDTGTSAESQTSTATFSSSDLGVGVDSQSTAAGLTSADTGVASDSDALAAALVSADTGALIDDEPANTPSAVLPATQLVLPTLVKILRQSTSRVNGSTSVVWNSFPEPPYGAGQFWCRIDFPPLQPGTESRPPYVSGVQLDRVGTLMADVWVAAMLRAGDRVECLSGPVQGIFDIRNVPNMAMGFSAAHHIEVSVIEVAQRRVGVNVRDTTPTQPSRIRHLYASRVEVLRREVASKASGSPVEVWLKIGDIVDPMLNVAGEMMCRIDLQFTRAGRDALPPIVAGRMQDRIGTMVCDPTMNLRAGDRVRCISGSIVGTFEIKAAPDLAPGLKTLHHLEMMVVEVASSLVGVQT